MTCKGTCKQYQVIRTTKGRYTVGQKRCQGCSVFLKWDGFYCPCCGMKLRTKTRSNRSEKERLMNDSHFKPKTIYVGSGIDPKLSLTIDKKYLQLVPRLNKEQYDALKESIKSDELQEPITVNPNGVILDGHTRYNICSLLDIPVKYTVKNFKTLKEEQRYVRNTNLKRRQMTSFQMVELLQDERKEMMEENRNNSKKIMSEIMSGKREKMTKEEHMKNKTEYKIAEIIGVGVSTVDKIHYVMKHGTDEQKEKCRNQTNVLEYVYREIVNQRHSSGGDNIRNTRTFESCDSCGGKTRFKGKCHVHKSYCCTKCEWGK